MTDDATPPRPGTSVPTPPPSASAARPRLRELSPKTMWLTAVVIVVLTAAAVVVLWWPATAGLNGAELVSARLDALKVGLSVAVGSGGVVALYLSWRRQHSTEADLDNRERALLHQQQSHHADLAQRDRVAQATESDARERRLNELYLKAVEQLGSSQAAVRHGGLYALERVAQDNPRQRQTVVNVICAYLRNPYTPPPEIAGPRQLGVRRPLLKTTGRPRTPAPPPNGVTRETQLQEREVRLTAQRILRQHLQPGPDPDHPRHEFWPDTDIHLTGATLIDFSLTNCSIADASFRSTTFTGAARFHQANFGGTAWFNEANFEGSAWFNEANFDGTAWFNRVRFGGAAWFEDAKFGGAARFNEANFDGAAIFDEAKFGRNAWFGEAQFGGTARFDDAKFGRGARFDKAKFGRDASFDDAEFGGTARFDKAVFDGREFDPAEHGVSPRANELAPEGEPGQAQRSREAHS